MAESINGSMSDAYTQTSTAMQDMSTAVSTNTQDMTQTFSTPWAEATQSTQTALTNTELVVTTTMTSMQTIVQQGMEALSLLFTEKWTAVEQNTKLIQEMMGTDLTLFFTTVQTSTTEFLTQTHDEIIVPWFTELREGFILPWYEQVKQDLIALLTEAQENLNTSLEEIKGLVETNMTSQQDIISKAWEAILDKLNTSYKQMSNDAKNAMNDLKNVIKAGMDEIKNQDWKSIGTAITDGVAQGIRNGQSTVINAAVEVAAAALAAAKARLGIASPSKVFREQIGENIGEGWAKGIEDTSGDVLGSVSDISKGITNEAGKTNILRNPLSIFTDLSGGAKNLMNTAGKISNVVAQMFAPELPSTDDMIEKMNRQLATSADVRVEDDYKESGETNEYLSGIALAVEQMLIHIQERNRESQGDTKVIIDGREVFNVVVRENNRAINRTGASPIRV
jgi:ElaB/YqjD/DUF883 family membrane-anchored ribosome-binding protein